jgi:hypothetical protein
MRAGCLWLLLLALLVARGSATYVSCQSYFWDWRRQVKYELEDGQAIGSTIYEFDMIVDLQDKGVSNQILDSGTSEADTTRTAARFVRKGDRVVVVGAHVGLQAILFARVVGKYGHVFMFESYSRSS